MEDITRRQAMKLVATVGAVATGVVVEVGKAKAEEGQGQVTELGKEESIKINLTKGENFEVRTAAFASDDCDQRKNEIRKRFQIAKFGSCNHPTTIDADAYALTVLSAQVIAEGGLKNNEAGHRTVTHKIGPITFHTYLSYASGDRL